jgi:hypothetical protein
MNLVKTSMILLSVVVTAAADKPPNAITGPSSQGKGMSETGIWNDSSQIH